MPSPIRQFINSSIRQFPPVLILLLAFHVSADTPTPSTQPAPHLYYQGNGKYAETPAPKPAPAPDPPAGITLTRDIQYANVNNLPLLMDIYLPKESATQPALPCVMYIHGGGWRTGDKRQQTPVPLASHGYVVASINIRGSDVAVFPAQIFDCKAALRFLRANASKYHIDPNHIGVWGDSSGGHLSALVGTSGDVKELEGTVGDNLKESSRVQAACVYYGPVDFLSIMTQGSDIKRGQYPGAPEAALLGGNTLDKKDLALQASPLTYISKDDPPFLIVHGSADKRVPLAQSRQLLDALHKAGIEADLQLIEGAPHGFNAEQQKTAFPFVLKFFDAHLKPK